MSKNLSGKVALVTDGSRGIGAATAKRLAADGASVAVTYAKGADAAASRVSANRSTGLLPTSFESKAAFSPNSGM